MTSAHRSSIAASRGRKSFDTIGANRSGATETRSWIFRKRHHGESADGFSPPAARTGGSFPATNNGNAIEVHGAASDAHSTGIVSAPGAGSSATMLAVVP